MKSNVIREKSFDFAYRIVELYKFVRFKKKEFVISKQILRSGTAVGALVEEALQAESKQDFIHKLSIANKEVNETHYWIRLLGKSGYLNSKSEESILTDCEELIKLLTSIIKSSKNNIKK
ncbi:MAG: four helix bundle protein [Ignavibacteriae bacterium]|nr:four helix bundle protein [Ignavibacteriota bacterium]